MGLISGIVFGLTFGIALMGAWRQMMNYRHSRRMAKAINTKLLNSLTRDDVRNICGDNFPEWISFPVFEQVKWLNKQLCKLWPYIADATEAILKETVEPLLEDYRPPGISSLKFSELSLGTVAPKIEGIRVQSLKHGQITMDIDLRWGGDPSIVLAVGAAIVASIPIQLKDLQVFTVVRAIFQLADEIPCISAVVIALLAEPKPRIDYTLKAVGGSLTAIPGISDMIDDTVTTIVTDMLQWPHRIVVPIGGIPVDTSDLELKPVGRLTVTVVKANDLKNRELIGKSDPYVALHIRPLFRVKTKVVDNNLNPVWNETFGLIAEDKETQALIVEVLDEDIGEDKLLGIVKLPLNDLEPEKTQDFDLRLLPSLNMLKIKDRKDRGSVRVRVRYHEFNKEEQRAALEEEKNALEEKKQMKEAGVVGSTVEAVDGAAAAVGTGITAGAGMIGSGVTAGAGMVGSGVTSGAGMVGSGVTSGAGMVGSGVSTGAGLVGSGIGAVSTGLSKAGKFMGRTIHGHKKSGGSSTSGYHSESENEK